MTDLCPQCSGTGVRVLERADGTRAVAECGCRAIERRVRRLASARIPERHRECTLENFSARHGGANRSLAEARMRATGFVRAYPADTFGNGLLFVGPCGVGKTHLAVGILHALIAERNVTGRFFDCKELLKQIQNSYAASNEQTERQVLRPALEAEVLVLDELGAARKTDWVSDMVEHVLNMRYNDRKTTIITTNLPYESAGTGNASGKNVQETLGDRIGERMLSRLEEMCVVVPMDGADYRKTVNGRATFSPGAERRIRKAAAE